MNEQENQQKKISDFKNLIFVVEVNFMKHKHERGNMIK